MQPSSCVRARNLQDSDFSYRLTTDERKSRNCLLEKSDGEDSWLLPLWPTRLADGLGLGSCPTSGCFLIPEDSPRSTFYRAVWVPRFHVWIDIGTRPYSALLICRGTMPWQPTMIPSIDLRGG